jgi:hypothetical protein
MSRQTHSQASPLYTALLRLYKTQYRLKQEKFEYCKEIFLNELAQNRAQQEEQEGLVVSSALLQYQERHCIASLPIKEVKKHFVFFSRASNAKHALSFFFFLPSSPS